MEREDLKNSKCQTGLFLAEKAQLTSRKELIAARQFAGKRARGTGEQGDAHVAGKTKRAVTKGSK